MSLQIPDSGNIMGGEAITRKQTSVNPMMDTRLEKVDVTPVADSLKNLGEAYKQYKDQENLALGQQLFNDYNEHIAQYEMDWKNSHKRYDAHGFYKALKDESWRFFNDRTGEPKNDGKIRTNDPDQKLALQKYIDKRQPDLISRAMAYEGAELTEAQRSTFESGLTNAAARVVANESPIEVADALADIDRITAIQFRGADPDYIRLQQAKERDVAVSALVTQKAISDPVGAALMLDRGRDSEGRPIGNELVYNNLNSATEKKLRETIKDVAKPKFKADTLLGKTPTVQDIMLTYGTNNTVEAEMIRNNIITEANKEKAVSDGEFADARASMISDMRNNVLNAKTPEEEFNAMVRFADAFPQEATQFQQMNNLIKQDDRARELIDKYDLGDLEYADLSEFDAEVRKLAESDISTEELDSIVFGYHKQKLYNAALKYREAKLQNAQQEARFYNSTVEGLTPSDITLIQDFYQRSNERLKNNSKITNAFTRVAAGDNLSTEELSQFDPQTAHRLIIRMNDVKDYNAMAAELRMAHVDLDKILLDTSYADFKNNPAKQAAIKGNLTRMMTEHKKNSGAYPVVEDIQRYVNRAIANSKTDADVINDDLHKRTTNSEMQKQLLLKQTDGKTENTSWDKKLAYIKKALKETIDESEIPQHKRKELRNNLDGIAEAFMTGNTATQQILTDLMGDY